MESQFRIPIDQIVFSLTSINYIDVSIYIIVLKKGRFQAIKTDVLLIFSFITGDKTEFLSPMMFSNEYITGI